MDEEIVDYGDFDDDLMAEVVEAETKLNAQDVDSAPSQNDIRLGKRVLQLEKERDELAAELEGFRSRYPNHSTTIPIPSPVASQPSAPSQLIIPHELLPTLSLLRSHINHLTRDNQALRYTFMGTPSVPAPQASSSKVTLDEPMASPGTPATITDTDTADRLHTKLPHHPHIDLEAVVGRVKELIKENEELGEMLVEAGRNGTEEWQKALDDSKAVITSLDSDLSHHLSVVQSLQKELEAYKNHFGPTPTPTSATPTPSTAVSTSRKSEVFGSHRQGHSRSHSHTHSRKDDPRDDKRHNERSKEKDREKDTRGESGSRRGQDRTDGRGGGGGGRGGSNGSKDQRLEEDRAWKRRR